MNSERWQKVKSILEEVIEVAPPSRAAYLDKACRGDENLRSEVESLLAFESAVEDELEAPAFSMLMQKSFDDGEALIGKRFGNYKILEKLGEGGMGAVFLAGRDDGEFQQKVAVKIIKSGLDNSLIVRRFLNERQILAGLEHPNIARLIEGGTSQEGVPYFVMEHVEGIPVTEYARASGLSLNERLDLFREICAGVSYAHSNLVIHRDLKPSNILITKSGTPKLLDFGIAKLVKTDSADGETRTHTLAFTPEYASPEQLRGEKLTTATDIYSLGVILYELLTGTRPFVFKGKNFGQIIQTVSQIEPARPSAINSTFKIQHSELDEGNPTSEIRNPKLLRGDLDNIILKALRKETARRYLSVEQFSEDIRRYLQGLPVRARQDTVFYRAEKFAGRNPLVVGAVGLAFLILIGGIVAVAWQARIAYAERARAERRFNDVRQLANSFMFEINEEINKSPIKARELLVTRALEYLDKLTQESEGDIELQSELATAYEKIGEVQTELFRPSLGRAADSLESHRKSLKIREALYAANSQNVQHGLDLAKSRNRIGDVLTMTGNQAEAVENYRQSIGLYEKLLASDPKNSAAQRGLSATYAKLGQAILRSGSLSESLKNYEKALEIQKIQTAENPSDLQLQHRISVISSYIGYVKMEMGDFSAALDYFQNALEIELRILRTDETNKQFQSAAGVAHTWVGVVFHELGETDKSLAHLQTALKIQQRIYEADKDNLGEQNGLADCFLELGLALKKAGRLDEAIETYEKAIENFEVVSKSDQQNLASRRQIFFTRRRLADALFQKGANAKALESYEKSLAAFKELSARDPNNTEWQFDVAQCHLKIGEFFLKQNDKTRATANFEAALPILDKLVAESPENVNRQRDLQTVRNHLGHFES